MARCVSLRFRPHAPNSRSAEEAVGLALEWENTVTDQIDGLMDLAIKENNHIARNILEWFVSEQLEEVSSTETLLGMVRRAGKSGLLLVESHLARDAGSLTAGSTESTGSKSARTGYLR